MITKIPEKIEPSETKLNKFWLKKSKTFHSFPTHKHFEVGLFPWSPQVVKITFPSSNTQKVEIWKNHVFILTGLKIGEILGVDPKVMPKISHLPIYQD